MPRLQNFTFCIRKLKARIITLNIATKRFCLALSLLFIPALTGYTQTSNTIVTTWSPAIGGTIQGGGTFRNGSSVEITVTASEGWFIRRFSVTKEFESDLDNISLLWILSGLSSTHAPETLSGWVNVDQNKTITAQFELKSPPRIIEQPQDVESISSAFFSVEAEGYVGAGSFKYQWYKEGVVIPGEIFQTLYFPSVTLTNSGSYSVSVSNIFGAVYSSNATLTVPAIALVSANKVITHPTIYFIETTNLNLVTTYTNGTIFYTLDGTTPTFNSTVYADSITITTNCELRAVAYNSAFSESTLLGPITLEKFSGHTITVLSSPWGGSILSSPGPFVPGETVQVSAYAHDMNNGFLGWAGTVTAASNPLVLTVSGDSVLHPVFVTSITKSISGSGSIRGNTNDYVTFGSAEKFYAIPNPGFSFREWRYENIGNGDTGRTNGNPLMFFVGASRPRITAMFVPLGSNMVNLQITEEGHGSVLKSSGEALAITNGTTVTLTALPGAGQEFLAWEGDAEGLTNPITITMDRSKSVVARFSTNLVVRSAIENGQFSSSFLIAPTRRFGDRLAIQETSDLGIWTTTFFIPEYFGNQPVKFPLQPGKRFYRLIKYE